MFSMSIPQISDEEVMKRYEQIKPVITVNGKLYHFREFPLKRYEIMATYGIVQKILERK